MTLFVSHPSSRDHDTGPHPENAGRLAAIDTAMTERDWLGVQRVEAPAAESQALERVHSPEHIAGIRDFAEGGGGMIDHDTVASAASFEAAVHAAGGAVFAAERLLAGDDRFAFCAMRPPGHHAESARAMGFCLFNNAAVAAEHALRACGAERVLILDWDVHHGNGTEDIFAGSNEVVYASIHQWPLYPGTGAASFTGVGAGEGHTINLPVPPGSGPDEFLALVEHIVAPVAREFRPGLLIVSAGYDAHRADPLASCLLDEDAFADMSATVRELGAELGAPVLVCLEGGYDPLALASSVVATIASLGGDRPQRPVDPGIALSHAGRVGATWASVGG